MSDKEIKEKEPESKKKAILKEIIEYVKIIVVVALVVGVVNHFFLLNARIPSESMETTVMKGDQLFGNRLAYNKEDPERFDIVIFKFPDDESQLFIKRIIGLPGETVTIKDGEVYINDDPTPLDDSFLNETMETPEELTFTVPEDSYFMMGDNRNNSWDSRYWDDHFVERDQILAKAGFRYWPLNKIGFID